MHHLTCGISSLFYFVNLILFTLLLVHLILRVSPHHSHHLCCHCVSLSWPFTADFKLLCFISPFHRSLLVPSHRSWTWTGLSEYWRLFVIVSSFYIFCFWLQVRRRRTASVHDRSHHLLRKHTLSVTISLTVSTDSRTGYFVL